MGMKGTCRSANRGGVPSFMPFLHIVRASVPPAFILSGRQFSAYRGKFSAKKGQKWINFWGCLVFSREFGRPKRAKFKIYLIFGGCRGCRCGSLFVAVVVSTGCRWCRASGSLSVCSVPFVLPFVLLLLLLSCNSPKICLISHFKGVLRHFLSLCVGLFGLGGLRWLWGFYARERLGGFRSCGVFCLSFSSFPLLSSCPAFVLLSCLASCLACFPAFCLAFLAFGVGWVVGFLSLSDGFRYKKKGRVLRPFLRSCVCSYFVKYKSVYLPAWLS